MAAVTLLDLVRQLARETGTFPPSQITTIEGSLDYPGQIAPEGGIDDHVSDLVYWIVDSNKEIETLHEDWRFRMREGQITMEPGRNDYPMAEFLGDELFKKIVPFTHPWHMSHIRFGDGRQQKIKFLPFRTFTGWYDSKIETATPAKPRAYTVLTNGQVRFYPTPDKDYTLYFNYIRRAAILPPVDICEPAMPVEMRNVIIYWAIDRWAGYDEATHRYQTNKQKLDQALMDLRNDQLPGIHVDRPTFEGGYGAY